MAESTPAKRKPCIIDGCKKPCYGYGWCSLHYTRWRRHGDPLWINPRLEWTPNKHTKICSIEGCGRKHRVHGWCNMHYTRWRLHGDVMWIPHVAVGSLKHGYRALYKPGHPLASKNGHLLEHRLIVSELLGRPLLKSEEVHHINGVRDDNRPENLELWNTSQPAGQRAEDKVKWAREILALYGDNFTQPRLAF